jgi:hypothetical protein
MIIDKLNDIWNTKRGLFLPYFFALLGGCRVKYPKPNKTPRNP